MPQQVVTNGAVSLPTGQTASKWSWVCRSRRTLQTLPVTYDALAFGEGIQKNVNRVFSGLSAPRASLPARSFDHLTALQAAHE
jgi:hypothetical protein